RGGRVRGCYSRGRVLVSAGGRGEARSGGPAGPRDALRLQLLDEGPRARMRGEAAHSGVPGAVGADDTRSPRDAGAHARRRVELARATPGAARGRLEERATPRRLPDGAGSYRSLAS